MKIKGQCSTHLLSCATAKRSHWFIRNGNKIKFYDNVIIQLVFFNIVNVFQHAEQLAYLHVIGITANLRHITNFFTVRRIAIDKLIIYKNFSTDWFYHSQYAFNQRGLSRSIRANQRDDLSFIKLRGYIIQRLQFFKSFVYVFNTDHNLFGFIIGFSSTKFSGVRLGIAFSALSSRLTIRLLNSNKELGFSSTIMEYMLTGW